MNTNPNFSSRTLGEFDFGFIPDDAAAEKTIDAAEQTPMEEIQPEMTERPYMTEQPSETRTPEVGTEGYKAYAERRQIAEYEAALTQHLTHYTRGVCYLRSEVIHPQATPLSQPDFAEAA